MVNDNINDSKKGKTSDAQCNCSLPTEQCQTPPFLNSDQHLFQVTPTSLNIYISLSLSLYIYIYMHLQNKVKSSALRAFEGFYRKNAGMFSFVW